MTGTVPVITRERDRARDSPLRRTPGVRLLAFFAPFAPDSRLACFRTVTYLFVLLDVHTFVRDPIPLSHHPELYSSLLIAGWLHLPPPSLPLTWTLYALIVLGGVLAAANRLPRLAGWVVAVAFTWWVAIGMSYGKVDHDHLALIVAVWLLPTAGVITGRWRASTDSVRSGWVLRSVQIAVIGTYSLSAMTKLHNGNWHFASWPMSSTLLWAIIRRPHGLGQFLLPHPELLRAMQWFAYLAEWSSPIVLWLRGRALLAAAVFWLGFHVFTVTVLYIHFAPTVVCWLAFAPLERFGPWLRRVEARRRQRARGRAAGHLVPVVRDEAVDGRGQ